MACTGPIETKDTLCILCQNACRNGCSWSERLEPVKGWKAIEYRSGYQVLECPEFLKETADTILPDNFEKDGLLALAEAIAARMRDDYIYGKGPYDEMAMRKKYGLKTRAEIRAANRKEIEKWLTTGQGRLMLQLSDPESVIKQLRSLARRYDNELAHFMR